MVLVLSLIINVWLWYSFGLLAAILFAVFTALILSLRALSAAFICLVAQAVVLLHLEWSFHHLLPRGEQHQVHLLTICAQQIPKRFDDDLLSGYAKVIEQPDSLALRRVKFAIYPPQLSAVEVSAGVCYRGTFRLRQPIGRLVPGSFNPDRYYFANQVDALATLVELDASELQPSLAQWLYRQQANASMDAAVTSVWAALGLGWATSMPSDLKTMLAQNQLMHLFVISGMHIGFLASLILAVLTLTNRCCAQIFTIERTAQALICLTLLALYVALLGFPIPATRALIMFVLPIFAWISGKRMSTIHVLSVTCFVISVWHPAAWLQMGTWLSVLSVMLLLFVTQWPPVQRLPMLGQLLIVQALLSLSILPWALVASLPVNPLSMVINLLITPLVAMLLLPLTLLLMIAPMSRLQALYQYIGHWLLDALAWSAGFGLQLPYLNSTVVCLLVLLVLSLLWSLRIQLLPVGLFVFIMVLLLWLSNGVTNDTASDQHSSATVTLFDVGHGQAVLLQSAAGNVLYDTGGRYNPQQTFYEIALRRAIPPLNAIIVSHSDADHAAGIAALHADQPNVEIWAGEPEKLPAGLSAHNCHQSALSLPGFQFVSVPPVLRHSDNNRSCILMFAAQGQRMLITGDADRLVEYYLLQAKPELLPADVLLLGHHGSGSSSATAWLQANHDALFLNSSGDRARPRWPAVRIEQWFQNQKLNIWSTAQYGTLVVRFSHQQLHLETSAGYYRLRLLGLLNAPTEDQ